jgi:hypothetical protein
VEHPVIGATDEHQIAASRRGRGKKLRPRERMQSHLLARQHVPGLQFTNVIGLRDQLQTGNFRAEPPLAGRVGRLSPFMFWYMLCCAGMKIRWLFGL